MLRNVRITKQTVLNVVMIFGFFVMFIQVNVLNKRLPKVEKEMMELHNDKIDGKAIEIKPQIIQGQDSSKVSIKANEKSNNDYKDMENEDDYYKPNCSKLLQGSLSEFTIAKTLIANSDFRGSPAERYIESSRNCDKFLLDRRYQLNVSPEEKDFPIAYSIIMYKNVEQVERLLRTIYRPNNFYCVHIDSNADSGIRKAMMAILRCFKNVFISSRSVAVKWGTFSVLEADFICMSDLLKYYWKYFINLTGQDFPLKTNLQLVKILKVMKGVNLVDGSTELLKKKTEEFHNRYKAFLPTPHNIRLIKGNNHIVASRNFVRFLSSDQKIKAFKRWARKVRLPDELFFSSVNYNKQLSVPGSFTSSLKLNHKNFPYVARFKNWGKEWGSSTFNWPCQGKRLREVCVFGVGDLPLLTTRKELFANKFDLNYDPYAIECLDKWLQEQEEKELSGKFRFNTKYYESLNIVKM